NDVDVLPSLATRSGDTWMVEIRAYDGEDYSTWVSSNPISVGQQTSNNAPTVDSIAISPTNPTTTDALVATSTSSDADMDSITITEYQWRRNGALVGITTSTIDPVSTNKGESWSVEARSFDGTDWSSWVTSSSIQILNSVPNLDSASISAGEVTTDENISVSSTMSDADGDSLTMSLKWYLDGTLQPEYNNQAKLSAQLTNKGDIWTAVVEAYDGSETSTTSQTFTVQILNSEPTISLELDDEVTSQDILTLDALVADRDEDVIETVSITWYRNGFRESSLDNATTVPSTYLGPGQEWSVEMVVTDGEVIVVSEASVIIDNAPPLAVISVLTDDLYAGERVHLSGTQSTDPDNAIVRYQWMWSGGGASGIETSFLMPLTGTIDVVLSVTDASGASNSTTVTLTSSSPLPCPNLTSIVSGNDVSLEWTWTSPEQASFEITRNGVIIGVTNSTIFADTPSLTGISFYQVQTYIDDRILESSCQSPSTDVIIESSVTDFEEGPSSVAGLGLGSIYVLLGILLLVSATLRRGD
ncbi:MAG: PKD domain-containing protein, partial [Candidatus Poseidoniaceae archaeon]